MYVNNMQQAADPEGPLAYAIYATVKLILKMSCKEPCQQCCTYAPNFIMLCGIESQLLCWDELVPAELRCFAGAKNQGLKV